MKEKLKTLRWFAARPDHWAHAAALVARKVKPDHDRADRRSDATEWAILQARPVEEVVRALGYAGSFSEFDAIVGEDQMQQAEQRVAACPVKMGGAGDVRLLYYACEAIAARRVLETGVAYGWSSLAILASLTKRPGSLLTSVDMPYPKMNNSDWVGIAVPERFQPAWRLIRQPDRNGIGKALALQGGTLDLCHYDSDKSYYGRMWAYPQLWSALRAGGIFISDDIQDNLAFKEFTETRNVASMVIESQGKYVGLCIKPVTELASAQ